jgi:hypothetical protein
MVEGNSVQPVKIELEVLNTLDVNDVFSRKETEIDSQLIDGLINLVKSKDNFSSIKEAPENVKDLYEVVIKPHLQEGIDSGNLEWNGVSAQIRNKKNGEIAGNIELSKHELEQVVPNKSAISNATKAICSVAGQMQLVEITQRLEQISEKIDLLIENERDKTNARLTGTLKTLQKALMIDDNSSFKFARIDRCIDRLQELVDYFEIKIDKDLNKEIKRSMLESIIDSFKPSNRQDIKFYDSMKKWLDNSNYYIQGYVYSKLALAKCYEVIEGIEEGQRELYECKQVYNEYLLRIGEKVTYLLKEKGLSVSESQDINQVIDYISKRQKHSRIKMNLIKLKENTVKGNDDISKLDTQGTGSIILELQDIQGLDKED